MSPYTAAAASGHWELHGSPDPDVVLAGHSHMLCMHRALTMGLVPEGLRAAVAFTRRPANGHQLSDPSYWDFFAEQSRDRVAAVVWNGNQHNTDFLLRPDPPVKVWSAAARPGGGTDTDAAEQEDGEVWVPRTQIRARWQPDHDLLEERLRQVGSTARRTLVLGTPPPKPDEFVTRALRSDPYFADVVAELDLPPTEAPVTPAATRLALWEVVQETLRDSARACGAIFVPVPAGARDDDGFLRGVLATADATHANAAYARLVWQEVSLASAGRHG